MAWQGNGMGAARELHAMCESALRRKSTADLTLRLWVRIPPGAWLMSAVSVVLCQVEVSASG